MTGINALYSNKKSNNNISNNNKPSATHEIDNGF